MYNSGMNFKRNFLLISALVGTVFCVAGCKDRHPFIRYNFIEEVSDAHEDEIFADGAALRKGNFADYSAKDESGNLVNLGSFYNVMTKNSRKKIMPAEGDQKILVIPVDFPDYKIKYEICPEAQYVKNLNKAFFGTSKNNNFVSVSQYYNVSSYGKLRLSGKVSEYVYEFPMSVETLLTRSGNDVDMRNTICDYYDEIIEDYMTHYDDIDSFKLDPESSTYNDVPLYLVYDFPTDNNKSQTSIFWNFTFQDVPLSWSSYHSLNIVNEKPDAHVFIHETGHLLGLNDYYPTEKSGDEESKIIEPVGCIDMMDSLVGDHTALSKMMLNWVRPIHVTDTCELTISSLTNKGDIILLNDNWNGSVFDEYYLLEFYTPTGLNTFDVVYGNDKTKLPEIPGVKLYHVDATLGYYNKTNILASCDAGGYNPRTTKIDYIRDNKTYSKTFNGSTTKNYLYELIYNHYNAAIEGPASDEHLYHKGDEIRSLEMNGGRLANYIISIEQINFREATIKITKR